MTKLVDLVKPWKRIASPIVWREEGEYWKASRVPLTIAGGNAHELHLRVKCPSLRSGHGFMLQVEYQPTDDPKSIVQLERVEWKVGHTNSAVGPTALHYLDIESTHLHRFDINYFETENRMLQRNLPLAVPVEPDPASLEEFLEKSENLLRIEGVSRIVRPGFQDRLIP